MRTGSRLYQGERSCAGPVASKCFPKGKSREEFATASLDNIMTQILLVKAPVMTSAPTSAEPQSRQKED